MTKQRSITTTIAAAIVSLGCVAAEAVEARNLSICAEHNALSGDLTVTLSNGCVSSSMRYLGQDLAVDVDQNHALINVTGGFNYEKLASGQMVKTDCGGGRSFTITVDGIDARRFRVVHGDAYAGILDLTAADGRICIKAEPVSASIATTAMFRNGWATVDYSGWERTSAPTVLGVLEPVYAWHPEAMEGRPELDIKMVPWPGREAMRVEITMTGFLDDSVAGERYVALVKPGGEGWTIGGLWRRNLCQRGAHAGQWTKKNCL